MGRISLVGWICLLLSGCVPALPYGKPREANRAVPATFAGNSDPTSSAQMKWDEFFTDPKLNALIAAALQNNQEVNIVAREIEVAQYEIISRKGDYLPKVDFRAGVGIEKVGRYTSQGAADEANGVPEHLPNFGFGFSASWELDIWSKLRNAARAAVARYLATSEGRKFAVTVLVREIATSYYELMALDAQLEVLRQNIEIQKRFSSTPSGSCVSG